MDSTLPLKVYFYLFIVISFILVKRNSYSTKKVPYVTDITQKSFIDSVFLRPKHSSRSFPKPKFTKPKFIIAGTLGPQHHFSRAPTYTTDLNFKTLDHRIHISRT